MTVFYKNNQTLLVFDPGVFSTLPLLSYILRIFGGIGTLFVLSFSLLVGRLGLVAMLGTVTLQNNAISFLFCLLI